MSKATLMTDFFKKANSLEETIPRAWLTLKEIRMYESLDLTRTRNTGKT